MRKTTMKARIFVGSSHTSLLCRVGNKFFRICREHPLSTEKFYTFLALLRKAMPLNRKRIAGLLLFVAGVECILGIILAETLYPGYSTAENYISDLGIGPSALIFNSAVFLLGALAISSVYFIHESLKSKLFTAVLTVSGAGAMGVGIFTEHVLLYTLPSP